MYGMSMIKAGFIRLHYYYVRYVFDWKQEL